MRVLAHTTPQMYRDERLLTLATLVGFRPFGRFDLQDLCTVADEAVDLGQKEAVRLDSTDLMQEAYNLGVQVVVDDHTPEACQPHAPRIAAFYQPASGTKTGYRGVITLVRSELQNKARSLRHAGFEIDDAEIELLHLAHEMYHAHEYVCGLLTSKRVGRVHTKGLLGSKKTTMYRAGEVAAHAFAQAVCRAPLHPVALDLAAMSVDQPQAYEHIQEFLQDLDKRLAAVSHQKE